MDDQAITYRGAVYPWHCDHVGHMNGLHMDTQARKSCPFPPELLARARALGTIA